MLQEHLYQSAVYSSFWVVPHPTWKKSSSMVFSIPSRKYDKFFYPPTTSLNLVFSKSRMLLTFHQMTSSLACPPWSGSNPFRSASIPLLLAHPQIRHIYLLNALFFHPLRLLIFAVRANI